MSSDRLPSPGHALSYFEEGSMPPIEALALFFESWYRLGRQPTPSDYAMLYRALKEMLPAVKEWPQEPVVYWSGEDLNGTPKYQAILTSYEKFKEYLDPFGPLFDAHEFIKAYETGKGAEYIERVKPADTHGGKREGAGRKAKDEDGNQSANRDLKKKQGKSNDNPERVIARLKRDAETDPKAQAILDTLEAGDISARGAALEMGWIKPPDPIKTIEKQREKIAPDDQVKAWVDWGRAIPNEALTRYDAAQEAFLNLTEMEQRRFIKWAQGHMNSAKAA
jgi:hypothetical protein